MFYDLTEIVVVTKCLFINVRMATYENHKISSHRHRATTLKIKFKNDTTSKMREKKK